MIGPRADTFRVNAFTIPCLELWMKSFLRSLNPNIYIFIAITLDESIFRDVLHFPMKNIKSRDLEATHMGGSTSEPASDVVCLLFLA